MELSSKHLEEVDFRAKDKSNEYFYLAETSSTTVMPSRAYYS